MEIIEERTIGPSLGADNIERGVNSVVWGLVAIAIFMCAYYMLFGVFSSIALGMNVLLLLAVLSMLQATLTLPGIAAMALAIGVAIDSNVLINERIREELRAGVSPQAAIHTGYERAWATILDSNVTTLIAGLALLDPKNVTFVSLGVGCLVSLLVVSLRVVALLVSSLQPLLASM